MMTMHRLRCGLYLLFLMTLIGCGAGGRSNELVATPRTDDEPAADIEPGSTHKEFGYITLTDGTRLRYNVERASEDIVGPVIMQYDGYSAGTNPSFGTVEAMKARLLPKGYVFVGVSIRGTGCSSGRYDIFDPQWSKDGAEAVEWIASQAWSDGQVAMVGYSYPGITQLGVAAEQPPSLKAIVPNAVVWDLYRDVAFPGGIFNFAFAALFTAQQQLPGVQDAPAALLAGDVECVINQAIGRLTAEQIVLQGLFNPYFDSLMDYPSRSPMSTGRNIQIPVLSMNSWQDQQTGPRIGGVLESGGLPQSLNPGTTWLVWANGLHSTLNTNVHYLDMMERFYDHYLMAVDNGWQDTPKLTIMHELDKEATAAGWVEELESAPQPEPLALYLHADGLINTDAPTLQEASAQWLYPYPTQMNIDSALGLELLWGLLAQLSPVSAAVFTTPVLSHDLELLGSASFDVWMSSTAASADVQVTLSEVRADGSEVFVQRGWLRASARRLDAKRSTALRPFHTFLEADKENLPANQSALLRVEILPFNHVFRQGSALRLIIDSPLGFTGDWAVLLNPTPSINQVHISPTEPSKLVVGVVNQGQAYPQATACGNIVGQPCRPSIVPVPSGALSIE